MRGYWLDQIIQDERLEICKKQSPSTNSLDQRQPLTTRQSVSSAMMKDVIGKSMNSIRSLREAIELSRNDKLRVKFSIAINAVIQEPIKIACKRSL